LNGCTSAKEYIILEKDGIPIAGLMDIDEFEDYLELQDPKVSAHIHTGNSASHTEMGVCTASLPHAAFLPPRRLLTAGGSAGRVPGDDRTANPHAHAINTRAAGRQMRSV
jgi:hypothetical protein